MRAELLSIGTELLLGQIANTNAQYLARELNALGIDVIWQTTVGDNPGRLADAFRQAMARADLVLATGGLGPTSDDLTREILAEVLGLPLLVHQPTLEALEAAFAARGRVTGSGNRKQARLPEGSRPLQNRQGTAPGVFLPLSHDKLVVLLPGPPHEMIPMFQESVIPRLRQQLGPEGKTTVSRTLRFVGIGESALAELVQDLLDQANPTVAPLAAPGDVMLRITAKAKSEADARALMAPTEAEIIRLAGRWCYGMDDETLASVVGRLLIGRKATLAVAESCTGGLLGGALTAVPGASRYFIGGVQAYDNRVKKQLLGVARADLELAGAVSPETAIAMARGVQNLLGCDYGLSITGIAGPGGGTPEKPVGTVWIGLASPGGVDAFGELFWGDRTQVRERAVSAALRRLWEELRPVATEVGHG
ncbi:MAG: competence/damage-inducible protein A [Bacillota bacterium]